MSGSKRPLLILLVVGLAAVLGAIVVTLSDDSPKARSDPSTSEGPDERIAEVTRVVEALRHGDPTGFDPAAWEATQEQGAVLPEGSTDSVVEGSTVFNASGATVDAVISAPGVPDGHHWVFLHEVDGDWLVYGTMPLEGAS